VVAVVPGLTGRLISSSFAYDLLPTLDGYAPVPPAAARAIERAINSSVSTLGPSSGVRAITDALVVPLLRALGFVVARRTGDSQRCLLSLAPAIPAATGQTAALIVGYNEPLSSGWRESVRSGVAVDARWTFCCNGMALRLVDSRRTWSRDHLEFDVSVLGENQLTQSALWSLARAQSLSAPQPLLERAIALSARHGLDVCRALGDGVLDALHELLAALAPRTRHRYTPEVLFEHSLTVLYRILFLLFAEARGLVPVWHPLYRDRYSLDSLVTSLLTGRPPHGLWKALQAISRLAHAGCSAGELSVTAFNGRLFSPAQAAAFDRTRVDDAVLTRAIVAVGTTTLGGLRARIAYRDLDVEQLGAVYERVLDYEPRATGDTLDLVRGGDVRKATGTFYTPRAVTSHVVRRTLEPLVNDRAADAILSLRILDPAMGSGAFLVAACRYLAAAAERALIREGHWHPHDVTAADRALLRRQIASRCLFGVDLNPMAVQLARLSLWLATLSVNKPLSFLDHHLVTGNSLIGARPDDIRRQPPASGRRVRRHEPLPLFDSQNLSPVLAETAAIRTRMSSEADDSAVVVHRKEQALAALAAPDGALRQRWRALDLWCAGWFWERGAAPDRQLFGELIAETLDGRSQLSGRITMPLLEHSTAVAERHRFFHWPLAFPEVFHGNDGTPLPDGGFDAVIGNPPWDMVRGDSGADESRRNRRAEAARLTAFVRESGVYHVETRAHANRYQLFVERALQLARPGGRIGLVLPSGIVSDAGAAPLRRYLFDRAAVDEITGLDNREAIFPIHRSVRFVLLACTTGLPTTAIRCRFGISRADVLEHADSPDSNSVTLTRAFLSRVSGSDDLGVPELGGEADLRLLERISAGFPRLGSSEGWNVQFGRELNASDDRDSFAPYVPGAPARPVVEGKQIDPFRADLERSRHQMKIGAPDRVPRRARLAYRDIASATNRLTLIAAIIPARAVTTHTLFCLKTPLSLDAQHVLCGLLNSFVANYLVRFRVNTHVTASLVSRLHVPFMNDADPAFVHLRTLVRELVRSDRPEETDAYAELQAVVAGLYGLGARELEHVLATFPLIPEQLRASVRRKFEHSLQTTSHGGTETRRF
jgi:hypothetical protein